MIRQIVGRLHVGANNRDVVREIRGALLAKARHDPTLRKARHKAYREGFRIHAENRALYIAVMSGRL